MFIFNRMDRKNEKMKPSYTDFDREYRVYASKMTNYHVEPHQHISISVSTKHRVYASMFNENFL